MKVQYVVYKVELDDKGEERSQNWTLFKIFPCGMRGALFSEKRTGAESK